jgi:hypothetical protein
MILGLGIKLWVFGLGATGLSPRFLNGAAGTTTNGMISGTFIITNVQLSYQIINGTGLSARGSTTTATIGAASCVNLT